jgi:hypothetical protein
LARVQTVRSTGGRTNEDEDEEGKSGKERKRHPSLLPRFPPSHLPSLPPRVSSSSFPPSLLRVPSPQTARVER